VETLGKPYNRAKKNRGGGTNRNTKNGGKNIEDREDTYLFHGNSLLLSDVHRIKFISL
jgi:hypothetical protein